MSLEFGFLLLGLLIGGYIGYQSRQSRFLAQKLNLPRDYLVGLNFLLNEEPDKAVDVFIKMLEVDSNTVETHLAVGKLFRKRGEVDRAIRIHQNLIARPQLDTHYREQSLFELGQDYLSAGVMDRAEKVFLELVTTKLYAKQALQTLLDVYQRSKEWEKAIEITHQLQKFKKENYNPQIAHYYCELAECEIQKHHYEDARRQLDKALQKDTSCVRASLLIAKIEMHHHRYQQALQFLKKIKFQNPEYLAESIEALAACYEELNDEPKLVKYLMEILESHPHVPVALILSERIRKRKGDKVAANYVADYVRRYPSLRGLHLFINLYISTVEGRPKEDLLILQNLTSKLIADKPDYQCISCGFSGKTLHWQCPGCKQWSSVKPVHCLEG